MTTPQLSFATRKALCVHLGESAGNEVANLLQHLARRIDELERNKVDVTPIMQPNATGAQQSQQRAA